MKSLILTLWLLYGITGCLSVMPKQTGQLKRQLISGKSDPNFTSEDIIKELSRGNNNYGFYIVSVYPYTEFLINTEISEAGLKSGESAESMTEKAQGRIQFLTREKTCFNVLVGTHHLEAAKFRNWTARLIDYYGKAHEAKFLNMTGPESVPSFIASPKNGYGWQNSSVLCGPAIDFYKGFKLKLIPYVPKNAPAPPDLEWY